ncbi:hypothetical protein CcaverHIS631_0505860 [Cutaneotrichosporon cavernicola]|nr:hypothetical protein CcaverHIS631_0505860 [Cutaneotrichosporon cavernicola]BEJ08495.1 hypothetical protein CcaverHIS641_0505890 [Cutaneotrichosporon cavernicola]
MSDGPEAYLSDWEEEEEEEEEQVEVVQPVRKDEPMSPVAVVLYVVFFYVVWQILTRADDTEILEHLPSGSPLFTAQPSYERNNPPAPQYQLPYALQQLPSPLPPAEAPSTWRWVLASLIYPVYIAITLIAIPLPFLLNALNLLTNIIATIIYPITSTFRLLARTFVLAPLIVVRDFLSALYPVYVFVGGVVGVGAFLGVAFGWAGRIVLNLVLRPRSRRRKGGRSKSKRRAGTLSNEDDSPPTRRHSLPPQSSTFASQQRSRPVSASFEDTVSRRASGSYERRFVPIVDVIEIDDGEYLPYEQSHTTARQGVVLGVRRRGGRV